MMAFIETIMHWKMAGVLRFLCTDSSAQLTTQGSESYSRSTTFSAKSRNMAATCSRSPLTAHESGASSCPTNLVFASLRNRSSISSSEVTSGKVDEV